MSNQNPDDSPWRRPASPEPEPEQEQDPWATTPRSRLTPPPGEGAPGDEAPSSFARPAENPWLPPSGPASAGSADEPPTTPYPTSGPSAVQPPGPGQPAGSPPGGQLPGSPPGGQTPGSQPAGSQAPGSPAAGPQPTGYPGPPPPYAGGPSYGALYPPPYASAAPGQSAATGPGYPGAYPPPPAGSHQWATAPAAARRDANPLTALFDFGFTNFATPGLVKIVYALAVVTAIGAWLLSVLSGFAAGSAFGTGSPATGFVTLLFGWIPALLWIAFTRFVLEGVVALIRIHDRVEELSRGREGEPPPA